MFGTWLVSLEFYEAGVEDSVVTDERCASGNEGLQQELVKTWAEEVGGGGEKEIITKVGSGRVLPEIRVVLRDTENRGELGCLRG